MTPPIHRTPIAHPDPAGYTLIEMVTTVAVLVIVLGLMISLARDVRDRSSALVTKDLLRRLDSLMTAYVRANGAVPPVTPLIPPDPAGPSTRPAMPLATRPATPTPSANPTAAPPDEPALLRNAVKNNEDFIRALRHQGAMSQALFSNLPLSYYDERTLRDAWGNPIVLMPSQHPAIGMAPGDRFFFFSAGPDRKFLTRDDNLYSYEAGATANAVTPGAGGENDAPPVRP